MKRNHESGQTLVIVVVLVVALLLIAGLAIDGGQALLNRRRMQNAADAAALAGGQAMAVPMGGCVTNSGGRLDSVDAQVAQQIALLAAANGVDADNGSWLGWYVDSDGTELGRVGAGIPNGTTGVRVSTFITRPTFFMGLAGQDSANASAQATAFVGGTVVEVINGENLIPVAVPLEVVQDLGIGDGFTLNFKNCKNENVEGCIVQYVLEGLPHAVQHRGWANLGHAFYRPESGYPRATGNSSANELKTWMEFGGPNVSYYADDFGGTTGDFMHAKPGTNSSAIGAAPVGEERWMPVFDYFIDYDDVPTPKGPGAPQGGDQYYHIVGFVKVLITGANQGGGTIDFEFVTALYGAGVVFPNTEFGPQCEEQDVVSVTLTE